MHGDVNYIRYKNLEKKMLQNPEVKRKSHGNTMDSIKGEAG